MDNQATAEGVILACSCFINELVVGKDNVLSVLASTGITKAEWNACKDTNSKDNILFFL